jgi:hypothetical protein
MRAVEAMARVTATSVVVAGRVTTRPHRALATQGSRARFTGSSPKPDWLRP